LSESGRLVEEENLLKQAAPGLADLSSRRAVYMLGLYALSLSLSLARAHANSLSQGGKVK
jgi:hypothetical protein